MTSLTIGYASIEIRRTAGTGDNERTIRYGRPARGNARRAAIRESAGVR